jgi:hypothetical protein
MRGNALRVLLAVTLCVVGAACDQEVVRGSGRIVSRDVEVSAFTGLEVSATFAVTVFVGDAPAVNVRADDNLIDLLDVGVQGSTLRIGLEPDTQVASATLQADVVVTSLDSLVVSGASVVRLSDGLDADSLSVELSGASSIIGPVQIGDGTLVLSGASRATLSGSATSLSVEASGASELGSRDLSIGDATIDLSGASHAEVTVTGTLSAGAAGASTILYAGSPTVSRSETSGASTIQQL